MVCAAAFAGPARAQLPLDAPSITFFNSGSSTARFVVTPGLSGAPGGFTVEWIPAATYDALGGWPDEGDPRIRWSSYTGTPTLNTTDGTERFRLPSDDVAGVQVGDTYDETGVGSTDDLELEPNSEYVVRVWANKYGGQLASGPSADTRCSTTPPTSHDCTYTQGYWKNHPEAWPTSSLKLGSVTYTKTQLLSIYARPAKGNGLISLAHQLIATKLNIVAGASAPVSVTNAVAQADALIGSLIVPPVGGGVLAPSATSGLTELLDEFNNGELGPGHCDSVTPAGTSSWGSLKARYR